MNAYCIYKMMLFRFEHNNCKSVIEAMLNHLSCRSNKLYLEMKKEYFNFVFKIEIQMAVLHNAARMLGYFYYGWGQYWPDIYGQQTRIVWDSHTWQV